MASIRQSLPGIALCFIAFAGVSLAQTSNIEGIVKGEDGLPLKDAVIKIDRKDVVAHYEVKTKKKGDYFHAGIPRGTYKITLVVNGLERDSLDNVKIRMAETVPVNFNLQSQQAKQQELTKAVDSGTLTQEQTRDMSAEQKAAIEKQAKERAGAMKKNKDLNDEFNQGMAALKATEYEAAVQHLTKSAEMDATQHVIWGNLAEAYNELSKTKTGAEKDAVLNKAAEAYSKAIALQPADANYHNNYALTLARLKKIPEGEAELNKAVQLDATNAGRYYYNLGAVLLNANQIVPACAAFDHSIAADANYADAHYQRAMCLTAKATVTADGQTVFPEGTQQELEKYLELKPTGQFADSAKGLLQAMGAKIQTEYHNPDAAAPAKKAPPKKKK